VGIFVLDLQWGCSIWGVAQCCKKGGDESMIVGPHKKKAKERKKV